jgi:hypothetical protein
VLAAGAGVSLLPNEASAAWPKTSDTPDPSKIGVEAFDVDPAVRWKSENGETGPHFNEERGYANHSGQVLSFASSYAHAGTDRQETRPDSHGMT